jgi:hypothetical protein
MALPCAPVKRLLVLLVAVATLVVAPAASAPAAAQHVAAIRSGHVVVDGKPFFPIMQWLQCPWLFQPNAALGINTFLGKGCSGTTDAQEVAAAAAANVFSVLPYGGADAGSSFLGWHFADEPDLDKHLVRPATIARQYRADRRRDATKLNFLTVNAGFFSATHQGLPAWMHGSAAPYAAYARATDLIGTDIYPIYGYCRRDAISWVADAQRQLVRLARGKPTYQWIEAASNGRCPGTDVTPSELRAEVWMAIVNGAKAIGYFTHSWTPTYSQFRVAPDVQTEIKRTDAQITALTPAILAPAVPVKVTAADGRVDAMARRYGGKTYVFAVNVQRTGVRALFTSPAFKGTASVYDEGRSVPVSGGSFADGFAPLAVHLYVVG